MEPLSVLVPAYNSAHTISDCLTSIRLSRGVVYELIVVDDHSEDATARIATRFADLVVQHPGNAGSAQARNTAVANAKHDIFVFIDADVLIKADTLAFIEKYLFRYLEVDALTGLLSKTHPNSDFFSQYKNLYMHYTFRSLPSRVTFLYGAIHALRRQAIPGRPYGTDLDWSRKRTEDTDLGQRLYREGKQIAFSDELEVIHLKKYTAISLIKNDFRVPFYWAQHFVKYKGWRQLARNQTGYAHASLKQIAGIVLVLLMTCMTPLLPFGLPAWMVLCCFIGWVALSVPFLSFLMKEKGILFVLFPSVVVTFLDQFTMGIGILSGFTIAFSCNSFRKCKNWFLCLMKQL